jgi:hypothetical protein
LNTLQQPGHLDLRCLGDRLYARPAGLSNGASGLVVVCRLSGRPSARVVS